MSRERYKHRRQARWRLIGICTIFPGLPPQAYEAPSNSWICNKTNPPGSENLCCVTLLGRKSAVSSFCFHSSVLPRAPLGQQQHLGERNRSCLSGSPLPPLGPLWDCIKEKKKKDASAHTVWAEQPVVDMHYLLPPSRERTFS